MFELPHIFDRVRSDPGVLSLTRCDGWIGHLTNFGQSHRVLGALGDDVAVSGEFTSAAPSQLVTSQRAAGMIWHAKVPGL